MISVRLLFNLASRTEGGNQKRNRSAKIDEEAKDEYKKEKETRKNVKWVKKKQ